MKSAVSGVILYDETIRQKAKDGTPLVDLIKAAGAVPGIKVDSGAKDLALSPGEKITEGLDGLRERLKEYYGLGARFAKWRAVIDVGPAMPTWNCIHANAQALARYAALCQEAGIVPIVEPEVLMDGPVAAHDIDVCFGATEWMLKTVFQELYRRPRRARRHRAQAEHGGARQEEPEAGLARRGRREDRARPQGVRARGGCRHRLSLGRPERRGRDRASQPDQPGSAACPGPSPSPMAAPSRRRRSRPGRGKDENVAAAQRAFDHRARMNSLAATGRVESQSSRKRPPSVPQMPDFVVCWPPAGGNAGGPPPATSSV